MLNLKLKIFRKVCDIDLWVGGLFESLPNEDNTNRANNGVLGPTFACLLANQFLDLKRGDRFFYENAPNSTLNTANTALTLSINAYFNNHINSFEF